MMYYLGGPKHALHYSHDLVESFGSFLLKSNGLRTAAVPLKNVTAPRRSLPAMADFADVVMTNAVLKLEQEPNELLDNGDMKHAGTNST
jgi:hypothetical protein